MKRRKPKPKSQENVLSIEERKRICNVCNNDIERLVVYGLLFTGMRVSEFLHVRREWVDFDAGIIRLPMVSPCNVCSGCKRSKTRKGKLIKPTDTFRLKTKAGERGIPMLDELRPILEAFFKEHNSVIEVLWYRQNINKIIGEVGERARIRDTFPHAIRATFFSMLAEKGIDALSLKQIAGWTKIDMADVYVKQSAVILRDKVKKLWSGG